MQRSSKARSPDACRDYPDAFLPRCKSKHEKTLLQLLNPIGLLAATAVLIPILVHLWRVRKGKTLRIGSIALITSSARSTSNSLRIHNWPLFLLRCLLVLLLACLLAAPVWQPKPVKGNTGWILIPKADRHLAYLQYRPLIDSLLTAHWELHDLGDGFTTFTIEEALANDPSSTDWPGGQAGKPRIYYEVEEAAPVRPWPLLQQLDNRLPADARVYVFTSNNLAQYGGVRPTTHLALQWRSYTTIDTVGSNIVQSWIGTKQTLMAIRQHTTPAGNYFTKETLATPPPGIDTSITRISLYPGNNTADARYVKAALQAIGEATGRRIDIETLLGNQRPVTPQQFIIRLDDQPAGELLSSLADHGSLFLYDTGQLIKQTTWLREPAYTAAGTQQQKVYQYIKGSAAGNTIWSLANGLPLLTVESVAGKQIFHYKSRFNPAWSDLVWEDGFAASLLPFVVPAKEPDSLPDYRRIADRQAMPSYSGERKAIAASNDAHNNSDRNRPLMGAFAFIALLVFIAERFLAYRQQRQHHA